MLPLDERPCNYLYPKMLFEGNPDYELLMPPREKLGVKKRAARFEDIRAFLLENATKVIKSCQILQVFSALFFVFHADCLFLIQE